MAAAATLTGPLGIRYLRARLTCHAPWPLRADADQVTVTDAAESDITSWSPLIVQALLGEQPTTNRTFAPDDSLGKDRVLPPRCSDAGRHPPITRVFFAAAAGVRGRDTCVATGRGAWAGRVTGAGRREGFAFGVAFSVASGKGCVDAEPLGDADDVDTDVGGRVRSGLGVAAAEGELDRIDDGVGVDMVTSSSPRSLPSDRLEVGLGVDSGAALLVVGARVVTAPNARPPRTQAPRASPRVRGLRSITHSPG